MRVVKVVREVKNMAKGTVKRWFAHRGYGFITPEGEGEDVFVHISDILRARDLREGEEVESEVESTYGGLKAVDIKTVSE